MTNSLKRHRLSLLSAVASAAALAAGGAGLTALPAASSAPHGAPLQSPVLRLLPDSQSPGLVSSPLGTLGIESFGTSVVTLQNLSSAPSAYALHLWTKGGGGDERLSGSLASLASRRVELTALDSVTAALYAGVIEGADNGGVVETVWRRSGARTAYEAQAPATDLLVPLVVRNVYSHASVLYLQAGDVPGGGDARIEMTFYEPSSGSIVQNIETRLPARETNSWDLWFDDILFGRLPNNLGGGFMGTVRVQSTTPLAAMLYGDELSARGASAYTGRPVSAASALQVLPFVARGSDGATLIAIANPSDAGTGVDVAFHPAASSARAGESIVHTVQVPERGAVYLDLSGRGRGAPVPQLASGPDFVGAVTVRSGGPVLAVAQHASGVGMQADTAFAYNAFGEEDLAMTLAMPSLDADTSELHVFNPSGGTVDAGVRILDASGAEMGSLAVRLDALAYGRVRLADLHLHTEGPLRAILTASAPVAAVAVSAPAGQDASAYAALPASGGQVVPTVTPTATASPTPREPAPGGLYLPVAYNRP